ncbi:hypothetical protein Vi05172_g1165 [Venturia inaequalis]|nr:hypothetical protein Vi05172_g1165 [Venturia inaequalis]
MKVQTILLFVGTAMAVGPPGFALSHPGFDEKYGSRFGSGSGSQPYCYPYGSPCGAGTSSCCQPYQCRPFAGRGVSVYRCH